ncbi:MAG: hypothetical protein K1X26_10750 [Chitinophagales bacterium]|nr:hypothetical protein [Chitinophagales bacterium]
MSSLISGHVLPLVLTLNGKLSFTLFRPAEIKESRTSLFPYQGRVSIKESDDGKVPHPTST